MTKAQWRWFRNYLMCLAAVTDQRTTEHGNLLRRIAWINENRL